MLTREELREIRRIEVVTKRQVNDQLAGSYHSVFKGRGMSFSEVRLYQPGDDIRRIDWNVSARANDVYVKKFVEERELTVMILVDMSGSLDFGSQEESKRKIAAKLTALLAFSAIKNNDRVGLVLFTDEIEMYIPPKKGRKHVLRMIREILAYQPGNKTTNIAKALEFLAYVAKRKTVAFLVSDFISPSFEKAIKVASRRHDLIPIMLGDPMEEQLPNLGMTWLEDTETGEIIPVPMHSRRFRSKYRTRRNEQRSRLRKLFSRINLDAIELQTGESFIRPLIDYFKLRARRAG